MSTTISLSPLVIMSITDHYTRLKYIKSSDDAQVFGVMLGRQEGKNVRILHSFETKFDEETKALDKGFTNRRLTSYAKMFPDFEFVGWYTTCTEQPENEVDEFDLSLNKQFEVFRENPLMLKMNVSMKKRRELEKQGYSKKDMPISIFEKKEKRDYIIEPTETERIALDDAKRDVSSIKDKSQLSVNLTTTLNSIKLLRKNVMSLIKIIKTVPEIRKNHEIIRQLASICNRLPLVSNQDEYSKELFTEYSEAILVDQLGVLNKAVEQIQEFHAHKKMKNIDELFE